MSEFVLIRGGVPCTVCIDPAAPKTAAPAAAELYRCLAAICGKGPVIRTGTPAASMEDPTPKEEKNRRFDKLCAVQNEISVQIHESYVGKTLRCLVDGKDKDCLTARTEGGRLVRFVGCDELIGTFQNITITGATTWSLVGELVPAN